MFPRRVSVLTDAGSSISLPITEFLVLFTLTNLHRTQGAVHAPAIARASNGELSIATVYGSLNRLEKKGVVAKKDEIFDLGSSVVRRILWSPTAHIPQEASRSSQEFFHDTNPLPQST
jgi:DNA-binding PadR family transcriptional regulator